MAWLSFYDITRHVILESSYMGIRTLPKRLFLKRSWIIFTWRSLMWMRFYCSPKSMRLPLNSKGFSKGGISSSLRGFWDINDSGLIAKSWD
jgi:hypothetical protein